MVGIGVGVILGLSAKHRYDDAHENGHCDAKNVCDQAGLDLIHDAQSGATTATVITGIGIAAVGTAVVLYLIAPTERAGVTVAPAVGVRQAGLALSGRF
jgi:hypothetical protein